MSDDKARDDDEDLMSDFKDLFPDDDEASDSAAAEEPAASAEPGEALDELDAFLDDFEKGFNPADDIGDNSEAESEAAIAAADEESSGREDESPAESVSREDAALELPREELDLAMSEADSSEVFDDHWGDSELAESEQANDNAAPEELALEVSETIEEEPAEVELPPQDEPAVEFPSSGTAPVVAAATQSANVGGLSKAMQWSVISIMLVALGLSATAAWLAFSTASEVEKLQQNVQALGHQGGTVQRDTPAMSSMRTELHTLAARVNELAVVIEGPMSHLRQTNEGALSDIEKRLAKLEATAPSEPPVKKALVTPSEPAKKSIAKPAAKSSGSGWVINLISLSSESDADAELKHLRSLGVRAEKQRAVRDGKVWYRLRVPGFSSYEGAKAYIDTIEKKTGVKNAWVAKE